MTKLRNETEGERTAKLSRADSARPVVTILWDGGGLTLPIPLKQPCVLGRGADADIPIDEPSISRRHAAIYVSPELAVEDLGSSNGTRVRGRALKEGERTLVSWNEPIEIGATVVIVRPPAGGPDKEHTPIVARAGIAEVERLVALVAPTDISVLLLGETGVGKGYFARLIHERSKRAAAPWVHLNCTALPENLLESELFGYERGAFSGAAQPKPGLLESASGGTVFLDEVGELPSSLQAKLLLAIERHEVLRLGALKPRPFDARFVSATNRPLDGTGAHGFRPDLYFRLAGLPITIPPLRARRDEIPTLAARFLGESCQKLGRTEPALAVSALSAMKAYAWPGNVRELASVIERALLWCGDSLSEEHLMWKASTTGTEAAPASTPSAPPSQRRLADDVTEIERRRIIEALETCGGNQSRAAEMLGISRRTLISRMITFGLPRPRKG